MNKREYFEANLVRVSAGFEKLVWQKTTLEALQATGYKPNLMVSMTMDDGSTHYFYDERSLLRKPIQHPAHAHRLLDPSYDESGKIDYPTDVKVSNALNNVAIAQRKAAQAITDVLLKRVMEKAKQTIKNNKQGEQQ